MRPSQRTHRRRIGVIDIGTNSTKLSVGVVHDHGVATTFFARRTSRLGEHLTHSGRISEAAAARTARDVRALSLLARSHGANVVIGVGTYAFRQAANGDVVARRIARRSGVPIRVLTGREEAMLAYLSVLTRLHRPKPYTFVIDVGGGSVEFVAAHRGRIVRARSLALGALRLTERHLHSDPIAQSERRALERQINAAVARALTPFRRVPPSQIDLVASGGSVTTALAMLAPRARRAPDARISRSDVAALADTCFARTLAQRKRLPGLPADRADIIPAGLAVVNAFLSQSGKRVLSVNDGGLREGVLIAIDAEFEAMAEEQHPHRH